MGEYLYQVWYRADTGLISTYRVLVNSLVKATESSLPVAGATQLPFDTTESHQSRASRPVQAVINPPTWQLGNR